MSVGDKAKTFGELAKKKIDARSSWRLNMSEMRSSLRGTVGVLFAVTVLILGLAAYVAFCRPAEFSSAMGSVFGAAAGLLAVLWFSASLYYQSQQLKEQREHFLDNFRQLREDNRRSALVLARDLLSRAEERALRCDPELKCIGELTTHYIDLPQGSIFLKSTDPNAVLEAGKQWLLAKEAPAVYMMRGIKNAAETYFRAIGNENIDYSAEPEMFVAAYGSMLWKLPFFEEYAGLALLAEFMGRLTPARASIKLAYFVAMFKQASNGGIGDIYRKDKIVEDIKHHKEAGYPLPEIAKDLEEETTG